LQHLAETQQSNNGNRVTEFVKQIMAFEQKHPAMPSTINEEAVVAQLGFLSTKCILSPGSTNTDKAYFGIQLFYEDNHGTPGILIHPQVLQLGNSVYDPIGDCIIACTPHDYPKAVCVRGKTTPLDHSTLQKITLEQNVARHPTMVRRLAELAEKWKVQRATLEDVRQRYNNAASDAEKKLLESTVRLEQDLSHVVRFNSNRVTRESWDRMGSDFEGAARKIQCSGSLHRPVVDEVTYANLLQCHEEHLARLGVSRSWIPRWYSYPPNWTKCIHAYRHAVDRIHRLRKTTDRFRELSQTIDRQQDLVACESQLDDHFKEGILALLDMFQRFAAHGNYLRWRVWDDESKATFDDLGGEEIGIGKGLRMSTKNVLSYTEPRHLGRDVAPGLEVVIQQLSWIGLQSVFIDRNPAPTAFPDECRNLAEQVALRYAARWKEAIAPGLPPPDWTSIDGHSMPRFAHPVQNADEKANSSAPLVRALQPTNGVQEAKVPQRLDEDEYVADAEIKEPEHHHEEAPWLAEEPIDVPLQEEEEEPDAPQEEPAQQKESKKKRTRSIFVDGEAEASDDDGEEEEEDDDEDGEGEKDGFIVNEPDPEEEQDPDGDHYPNPYNVSDEDEDEHDDKDAGRFRAPWEGPRKRFRGPDARVASRPAARDDSDVE
jgi:hypothetical protein